MKVRLKPFSLALCLAGCISTAAFALQGENSAPIVRHKVTAHPSGASVVAKNTSTQSDDDSSSSEVNTEPSHKMNRSELYKLIREQKDLLPFDLDVPGQAFVSTGPYVGVPLQFSGANLLINSPSVNTDAQLLGIRKKIVEQLRAMGGEIVEEPYHSHLLLSGVVEVQALYNHFGRPRHEFQHERRRSDSSDIDLTNVSLDAFFLGPSNWLLGFIEFMFDGSEPANSIYTSPHHYRVSNSRVLINKAFITIGDFSKTPWYGTFGQSYVPYGRYSSVMVSDTLTKLLGRTKARYIELGYMQQQKNAFYGALYIFRGDSHTGHNRVINNGGINFGFKYSFCDDFFNGDFGGGIIRNIADSGGLQLGNGDGFSLYEHLKRRVPGINARGIFSFGEHIDVITEWVSAASSFARRDMSYNCKGAQPWALDAEISYSFKMMDGKPTSIALGYGRSHQALAMGLPKERFGIVGNTSLFRNTLQSLELRDDREYGRRNKATGANCSHVPRETGKHDMALTAQFDYYF